MRIVRFFLCFFALSLCACSQNRWTYYIPEAGVTLLLEDGAVSQTIYLSHHPQSLDETKNLQSRNTYLNICKRDTSAIYLPLRDHHQAYLLTGEGGDMVSIVPHNDFVVRVPKERLSDYSANHIRFHIPINGHFLEYETEDGARKRILPLTHEQFVTLKGQFPHSTDEGTDFYLGIPSALVRLGEEENVEDYVVVQECRQTRIIYQGDTLFCSPDYSDSFRKIPMTFYIHPQMPDRVFYDSTLGGTLKFNCKTLTMIEAGKPLNLYDSWIRIVVADSSMIEKLPAE